MGAGAKRMFARVGSLTASVIVLACAFPALALAEEKTGVAVILPDMNEFLPMLISFIVIVIILGKWGWPAFDGVIERRDAKIKQDLKDAEDARIEAQRELDQYRSELANAKKEASAIIADAKKAAEGIKTDIEAQAQTHADEMISKARIAIDAERKKAQSELQGSVADISVAVASRIIGQDLSDADHRRVIERYVEEAGSLNAN